MSCHTIPCRALQVWYAIAYVGKYADELEGEAPVATPAVPAPDDAYIDAFSRYVYGRQAGRHAPVVGACLLPVVRARGADV